MDGESRRQRTAYYQQQRERYLQSRMKQHHPTLVSDSPLLTTRYRYLPVSLVAPFVVLAMAGMFDLAYLVSGAGFLTLVSFALIPAGVVGTTLAVAVAARDWFAISPGSRVRSVGAWFVMGAAIVIAIFGWSWIARIGTASDAGGVGVVLGVIGATVAVLSGLLLADFLDRLSVLQPESPTPELVEQPIDSPWAEDIVEPRRIAHA